MRRLLPALALALLVALATLPAEAQPGERRPTPATPTPDKEPRGEGRGAPAFGEFTVASSTQTVSGDFVAFSYTETAVQGFAVGGAPLFDLRVEGTARGGGEPKTDANGAEVDVETGSYRLKVHDNPVGVTRVDTQGTIFLTLVPGAIVTLVDEGRATFTAGNVSGTIRGKGLGLAGATLSATDQLLLLLDNPHATFDAHRGEVNAAVAKGHVGAEASFHVRQDGVAQDIVHYGNVTMRTLKAERGNLTVLVDGHGTDGRVLVLNVDGRVVGATHARDLSVLFDNITIIGASTIEDVLDPDDDGPFAEYYVVFDPSAEAFQLLVSVPHYSVHTVSVLAFIPVPPPSVVIGIVAGVALLVPSALVLFRRGKA